MADEVQLVGSYLEVEYEPRPEETLPADIESDYAISRQFGIGGDPGGDPPGTPGNMPASYAVSLLKIRPVGTNEVRYFVFANPVHDPEAEDSFVKGPHNLFIRLSAGPVRVYRLPEKVLSALRGNNMLYEWEFGNESGRFIYRQDLPRPRRKKRIPRGRLDEDDDCL